MESVAVGVLCVAGRLLDNMVKDEKIMAVSGPQTVLGTNSKILTPECRGLTILAALIIS